ncbi:MAG: hypothetical protein OXF02_05950 [Simkaniaceae bacterium]|nr:hypothetical protein [Simkaniaceae bacterium]
MTGATIGKTVALLSGTLVGATIEQIIFAFTDLPSGLRYQPTGMLP